MLRVSVSCHYSTLSDVTTAPSLGRRNSPTLTWSSSSSPAISSSGGEPLGGPPYRRPDSRLRGRNSLEDLGRRFRGVKEGHGEFQITVTPRPSGDPTLNLKRYLPSGNRLPKGTVGWGSGCGARLIDGYSFSALLNPMFPSRLNTRVSPAEPTRLKFVSRVSPPPRPAGPSGPVETQGWTVGAESSPDSS